MNNDITKHASEVYYTIEGIDKQFKSREKAKEYLRFNSPELVKGRQLEKDIARFGRDICPHCKPRSSDWFDCLIASQDKERAGPSCALSPSDKPTYDQSLDCILRRSVQ